MNEQRYFDTFNDSEYSDFEQLATVSQSPDSVIADLRQQLAAVTAERDALETALAEALDSANYWHSQSVSKGGE